MHSSNSKKRLGLVLICLGVLLSVFWCGDMILRVRRVLYYLNVLQVQSRQIEDFLTAYRQEIFFTPDSIQTLHASFSIMEDELNALERNGAPLLALSPYLEGIPDYGENLRASPQLLQMSKQLIAAAKILTGLMSEAAQRFAAGEDRTIALARTFYERPDQLEQVHLAIARAVEARDQIDTERLPERLASRVAQFDRFVPMLRTGLQAGELLPYFLGIDQARIFLVLAQSEDELRPTGGFITAAGYLVVDNGRVVELDMRDSYTFDDFSKEYPYPPEPILEYMGAEQWLLRDANWSADFPESAETAAALARISTEIEVDGVIALDQAMLGYLLEVLGTIDVPAESGVEQVTAENFSAWMRRKWAPAFGTEQNQEWWLARKSFIADLTKALRARLESGASIDTVKLAETLLRMLQEKHLLLYSRAPEIGELLNELGWDGHIDRASSDYLMAVEANVGFNKASPMIERGLKQQVRLGQDGSVQHTVTVNYYHRGTQFSGVCDPAPRYDPVYEKMMNRCYWNYLRLIVPAAAELRQSPDFVAPGEYLLRGKPSSGEVDSVPVNDLRKSWGQLSLLQPGQSVSLEYLYELPPGTVRRINNHSCYNLMLQKQPGISSLPVSLQITLPEGARLLSSTPLPGQISGASLYYELDILSNQSIIVNYE